MRSLIKNSIKSVAYKTVSLLSLLLLAAVAVTTQAQDESLRAKLVQAIEVASQNQLQVLDIRPTALTTIFEIELNTGEMLYSDVSGDYLFAGDMYQTTNSGLMNLSAGTRQVRTLEKIAAIPEDQMIIFTPETDIKASLTVFTDVDCTYCRALHREMDTMLEKGIQVRYLAYPRGGENADSYQKMISVWCSEDRHKSITQAKNGQNLPEMECETPILTHYALGNELGITGTPALIFPDGRLIPGFVEADQLATMLQIQ
ncbi:MAG TPA: protein-disulfide isomerase [Gammaproteobacteria bacterium]|nr:DsbC family protein [Gammaproteobacteria bacterium]MDP6732041.1 DsbC family protein [Gammaproteobacteria bacterium]HAJ75755.1 protein-disulfide isomerase [Gammaproteobacteria bacterium]|tara:strand:+ start:1041 stop:1814 length:774 start_codon:yes stop_codon:yes gene_type:complete